MEFYVKQNYQCHIYTVTEQAIEIGKLDKTDEESVFWGCFIHIIILRAVSNIGT